MKKALSIMLAIALVFTMIPMSAFAAANPRIYFETDFSNELGVGDTFTVTAMLEDNEIFSTMTLSLDWNENVVQFNGFDVDRRGSLVTEVYTYSAPVINNATGVVVGADAYGYDTNGMIFTANFEIIAESGELGLGLKTDRATQFEMADLDMNDIPVNLDFSAITGLTVGGKPVGPEMPEDAPFTAITTDVGPIVAIEEADWIGDAPYYIVTIPADAETAYVTAPDQVVMEDWTTGELQATAYASDLSFSGEPLYISYNYEDTADGPKVEIPMNMWASDWSGEVELDFINTHAFGIEDAGYACLGWISFVYDDGLEEYNISIDENMVGGTIYACDEDGNEITKAKAGETVFVEVEADEGYTTTGAYYINGQLANDFMFVMPEEDVVLTATFQKQHTHVYDQEVAADKYLKDAATCSSGAVYYKSCECGEFVTTAETFVSGETVDHSYVDGTCKWCGAAEPVQTPGYRFATSADVSAENGGTAVVKVKITGHSDPNVKTYNAYDLTLTYDSTRLKYVSGEGAVSGDKVEIREIGNTIQIVGVGEAKGFDVQVATLTFETLAQGPANVTVSKVQVSAKSETVSADIPEAMPKHDENDTTNKDDETPGQSVIVVPYTVNKPDFVSGNNKILHGKDYTFSYTDTANYTYSDLTVTVGGVAVENLVAGENGIYTIENVTGAIEITVTRTAKSYTVTVEADDATVNADKTATYGTDYTFTVTPSDGMEIASVKVIKTGVTPEEVITYTKDEDGTYRIAGNNINADFTITVDQDEKAAATTTVTFNGISAAEIEGGNLVHTVNIGEPYTFKLIKDAAYSYTVEVGETELTESTETAGQYTIPAELVVEGGVTVNITKTRISHLVVEVKEYVNLKTAEGEQAKTMFLVTAKDDALVLTYDGQPMYYSTRYGVAAQAAAVVEEGTEVEAETEIAVPAGAYCWLIVSTDNAEAVKEAALAKIAVAAEETVAPTVAYDNDVNQTTMVDVNDAQLAYDMYMGAYEINESVTMDKFLEADASTDGKLDVNDVVTIIRYIIEKAAN